jgi:streptogramin lyase
MNIAHNPGRNVNALNNLPKANAAFEPTLGNNPPEAWTIAITYTAGGSLAHPAGVAADQAGNIWIANTSSNSVTELAPTGIAISGGTGYAVGQSGLGAIAIDQNGNAWVPGNNTASLTKISKSGSTSTYAGGGLGVTNSLAIDGLGMVWAVDGGNNLSAFTNAGVAFSPLVGFTGGGLSSPQSIAITSR